MLFTAKEIRCEGDLLVGNHYPSAPAGTYTYHRGTQSAVLPVMIRPEGELDNNDTGQLRIIARLP